MSLSTFLRRAGTRYEDSVVRRTAILIGLGIPAFCASLLIQYAAARLLAAENFGLFYVAATIVNVLFSASFILNVYFTRYLIRSMQARGPAAVFPATQRVERAVVLWGGGCAALVLGFLLVAGTQFGVRSWLVVLFIVVDAYASYLADVGRTALQSLRAAFRVGIYTLSWMVLRLLLCVAGIVTFETVWGALAGAAASGFLLYAASRAWIRKGSAAGGPAADPLPPPHTLIPLVLGYGLLIGVSHLDVLLGYFLLVEGDLATYSASSILPKAIVMVTMPLTQMMYAIVLARSRPDTGSRFMMHKLVFVVVAVAAGGAGTAWLLSGWLCGGAWGFSLCREAPLNVLLLSVVPLTLLRIVLLLQFARGRDWTGLWLLAPTAVYLLVAWNSDRAVQTIASQFVWFGLGATVFFACVARYVGMARRRPD